MTETDEQRLERIERQMRENGWHAVNGWNDILWLIEGRKRCVKAEAHREPVVISDAMVDRAAQAMVDDVKLMRHGSPVRVLPWGDMPDDNRDLLRAMARAALTAALTPKEG